MRVLVACEFSGVVRDAFRARGHEAYSCDLVPDENNSPYHLQCDVRYILAHPRQIDLLIAHPPCTYLTNAGVRWLHEDGAQRWTAMLEAASFFTALWNYPAARVAVENPIPHGYARERIGAYSQLIQPWQFGHGETKATCLWLRNLPPLVPTNVVEGRVARVHRMAPGPARARERSRTFAGIAAAMAAQWG